jgi:membrane carboxypeptidase/penicillin-binding protein
MGYDDFASLGRKDWTGGSTVVPWWTDIMEQLLKDAPKREFPVPPGIVFSAIDAETGLLFQPTCPRKNRLLEAFQVGTAPTVYCEVDHSKPVAAQVDASGAPAPTPDASMLPPGSTGVPVGLPPAADPDAPAPLPSDDELAPLPPSEEEEGLE